MRVNVPAVFLDGVIKPTTPLDVPNGSALEIDIRVMESGDKSDRAVRVRNLAAAFERIRFTSGERRFNREDLYDRD
jgi:predicted DNA-binding antitoxin AbrB/MazE fold protein